jgi:hypothetical protein
MTLRLTSVQEIAPKISISCLSGIIIIIITAIVGSIGSLSETFFGRICGRGT